MDELDRSILGLLRTDGRATFTDMAVRLKVSEGTVRARMKRLSDDGTIRQFTIRTAGSQVKALVEVAVKANVHTSEIGKSIRGWPSVETVWELTGDNDLMVVADCPTTEDLNALIDRIRGIPGTEATRSRLILKEH